MSNWHVRSRSGDAISVLFHIPVPAGSNAAGVAWSAAILNSAAGGTTALPAGDGTGNDGGITAAEKAQIVAGTLLEVGYTFHVPPGMTVNQLAAALTAAFNQRKAEMQGTTDPTGLGYQLNLFGGAG